MNKKLIKCNHNAKSIQHNSKQKSILAQTIIYYDKSEIKFLISLVYHMLLGPKQHEIASFGLWIDEYEYLKQPLLHRSFKIFNRFIWKIINITPAIFNLSFGISINLHISNG